MLCGVARKKIFTFGLFLPTLGKGMEITMNILLVDWNAMGNKYVEESLKTLGHNVFKLPFDDTKMTENEVEEGIRKRHNDKRVELIFSFNYFPSISNCCNKLGLKYVSWVYDSPYINVYSYTVINPCNYIFLFDYGVYAELANNGIKTVYYHPLGVSELKFADFMSSEDKISEYSSDISFVGSFYNEKKHDLYSKFDSISEFSKGYLDALIEAQLNIYGESIIENSISESVFEDMSKAYPVNPDSPYVMKPKQLYTEYVLLRKVTSIERLRILDRLSKYNSSKNDGIREIKGQTSISTKQQNQKVRDIRVYTHDSNLAIPNIKIYGPVDYYEQMPHVFRNSKINLNISLRSIRTGIPLRVLDIMASGGFVITNYQAELMEYFEPDKDIVIYYDHDDLIQKIDYYLEHDEERVKIAENGRSKVIEQFGLSKSIAEIINIAFGNELLEEK